MSDGSWEARGEAMERQWEREEQLTAALDRLSRLYREAARELAEQGWSRRYRSLVRRANDISEGLAWTARLHP